MRETWRWFGPDDPVSLDNARQAGAAGIVTALHHITDGRAWSDDEVAGLTWDVCESIPVSAAIKLRQGPYRRDIDAWKDSLESLVRSGVATVCYNFMPVVDWTRTDLAYPTASKGLALRFDMPAFVAYDVFVLERPGAETDYSCVGRLKGLAEPRGVMRALQWRAA
jgi:mannonate dehydratase